MAKGDITPESAKWSGFNIFTSAGWIASDIVRLAPKSGRKGHDMARFRYRFMSGLAMYRRPCYIDALVLSPTASEYIFRFGFDGCPLMIIRAEISVTDWWTEKREHRSKHILRIWECRVYPDQFDGKWVVMKKVNGVGVKVEDGGDRQETPLGSFQKR